MSNVIQIELPSVEAKLDRIIALLEGICSGQASTAPVVVAVNAEAAEKARAVKVQPETVISVEKPPKEVPQVPTMSVDEMKTAVRSLAVRKIQAGKTSMVKSLIEKHGGTKVSNVPDENLGAFKAELEAL